MTRKKRIDRNHIVYELRVPQGNYIGVTAKTESTVFKSVRARAAKHYYRAKSEDRARNEVCGIRSSRMNKRIRELYNQSLVVQNDDAQWIEGELDSEKFAELIVQECAELFEVEYGQTEVSGNEVARVLKQHFGVEE